MNFSQFFLALCAKDSKNLILRSEPLSPGYSFSYGCDLISCDNIIYSWIGMSVWLAQIGYAINKKWELKQTHICWKCCCFVIQGLYYKNVKLSCQPWPIRRQNQFCQDGYSHEETILVLYCDQQKQCRYNRCGYDIVCPIGHHLLYWVRTHTITPVVCIRPRPGRIGLDVTYRYVLCITWQIFHHFYRMIR